MTSVTYLYARPNDLVRIRYPDRDQFRRSGHENVLQIALPTGRILASPPGDNSSTKIEEVGTKRKTNEILAIFSRSLCDPLIDPPPLQFLVRHKLNRSIADSEQSQHHSLRQSPHSFLSCQFYQTVCCTRSARCRIRDDA